MDIKLMAVNAALVGVTLGMTPSAQAATSSTWNYGNPGQSC